MMTKEKAVELSMGADKEKENCKKNAIIDYAENVISPIIEERAKQGHRYAEVTLSDDVIFERYEIRKYLEKELGFYTTPDRHFSGKSFSIFW